MSPVPKGTKPGRIKPKRLVDKVHLAYVGKQPCCCCGARPVQIHHLIGNYGPDGPVRGVSLKAGDNFTIGMCHPCHFALHNDGNEVRFLERYCVDGLALAARYWSESHGG